MTAWSDDKKKALRDLWAQGLSASQCAARLGGGLTRNAVLSKVHRMGLPNEFGSRAVAPSRANAFVRNRAAPPGQVRKVKTPTPVNTTAINAVRRQAAPTGPELVDTNPLADHDIPIEQRKRLIDLEPEHCRWPIGDPQHPDFAFCAALKVIGASYCGHHLKVAFAPPLPKRPKIKAPEKVRTFEDA